jgi:mRNA interferase MazF
MGQFIKGDVVIVPFPFSDLSRSKRRPAVVITELTGDDVILCQITTPEHSDGYSIPLMVSDFASGSINHDSNIRPNHLFTASPQIIAGLAGKLSTQKIGEVVDKIIEIIRA